MLLEFKYLTVALIICSNEQVLSLRFSKFKTILKLFLANLTIFAEITGIFAQIC